MPDETTIRKKQATNTIASLLLSLAEDNPISRDALLGQMIKDLFNNSREATFKFSANGSYTVEAIAQNGTKMEITSANRYIAIYEMLCALKEQDTHDR